MSELRAAIGYERRRQMQIRAAFEAGLALRTDPDLDLTDFFVACAAYIVFSMDRLHQQDQVIHDLLKERISQENTMAHEQLDVLNDRQQQSRELVEKFQMVAEELSLKGPDALDVFEAAAIEFTRGFSTLMAPRKNPFQKYTDELFTDDDWQLIAAVSDESRSIEKNLYSVVQISSPGNIDPEVMTVVYH